MIHDRRLVILLVCLVGILAAAPLSAETIADFADGMSTTLPDGYVGVAGNGWAGPWVEAVSSSNTPTVTKQILTTNPLHVGPGDEKNYLDVQVQGVASTTSNRYFVTGRDYKGTGGVDVALPHTIDFLYRVNETLEGSTTFKHFNDRYQIYDGPDNAVGASSSWFISCYGGTDATYLTDANMVGKWVVYNGLHDQGGLLASRQVNTGVTVTAGTIYAFHIEIDPSTYTYDVTISSGGSELYDSTDLYQNGLGWRTSDSTVEGFVHFNGTVNAATDLRKFSLDSIRIVPEPSTLLMVISAVMILAGASRQRG